MPVCQWFYGYYDRCRIFDFRVRQVILRQVSYFQSWLGELFPDRVFELGDEFWEGFEEFAGFGALGFGGLAFAEGFDGLFEGFGKYVICRILLGWVWVSWLGFGVLQVALDGAA